MKLFIRCTFFISQGNQELLKAAKNGNVELVRSLLSDSETDPDTRDGINKTALILASELGHESVVKLLLTNPKVNVNAVDIEGKTPLIHASVNGRDKIIQILLEDRNKGIYK